MHKRIDSRARLALGLLSLMGTSVSDKAHAQPDESDEAELSASFQYDAATQTLQTKYFFHNSAAYPLVVFDRGDSRGRRASEPVQLTDPDGVLTLTFQGFAIPEPGPTAPVLPLGRKLDTSATALNRFSLVLAPPPQQVRLCVGYAKFAEDGYLEKQGVLQANAQTISQQTVLCSTPVTLAELAADR